MCACVPGKECNRVTLLAAVVVLGPEAGYWSGVRSLLPQPGQELLQQQQQQQHRSLHLDVL